MTSLPTASRGFWPLWVLQQVGLLPGTGGHATLARLRGNAKVRGRWAAGAGMMGRQGLSMNRHLKLQLRTSVTPRSRSKELGKMAGRKPN